MSKAEIITEVNIPEDLIERLEVICVDLAQKYDLQSEFSIIFVDDKQIRELKNQYWGEDQPTDVLSFPQWEPGDPFFPPHLGDIFISIDTATNQAHEQGHTLIEELAVLVAHGLIHLLGHDHQSPDDWIPFKEAENFAKEMAKNARN